MVLHCIVLYCTSLYYIALFLNYIVLHCFVFNYCEFETHSWRGVLYTTLCDIKNKNDGNDITEVILKVASNAITLPPNILVFN